MYESIALRAGRRKDLGGEQSMKKTERSLYSAGGDSLTIAVSFAAH